MDQDNLFSVLDIQICEQLGQDDQNQIQTSFSHELLEDRLSCHEEAADAWNCFVQCYYIACKVDGSQLQVLTTCVLHSLERQGTLFSEQYRTVKGKKTIPDCIILLLSRMCFGELSICNKGHLIRWIHQLIAGPPLHHLLSSTLRYAFQAFNHLLLNCLSSKRQQPDCSIRLSHLIADGWVTILCHPQWNAWEDVESQLEQLQSFIHCNDLYPFADHLWRRVQWNDHPQNCRMMNKEERSLSIHSIRQLLLSSFLLPALEQYLQQPKQCSLSSFCKQAPTIASFFILYFPSMNKKLSGLSWSLWCDCVRGFLFSRVCKMNCMKEVNDHDGIKMDEGDEMETEMERGIQDDTIIQEMVYFILHQILTIYSSTSSSMTLRLQCLVLLHDILVLFQQCTFIIQLTWKQILSKFFLRILSDTQPSSDRLYCRCVQTLPLVIETSFTPIAVHLVLRLFSNSIKQSLENTTSTTSTTSLRSHCVHFLQRDDIPVNMDSVYNDCLISLLPVISTLTTQQDLVSIIRKASTYQLDVFLGKVTTTAIECHPSILQFILSVIDISCYQSHMVEGHLTDVKLSILASLPLSQLSHPLPELARSVLEEAFTSSKWFTPRKLNLLSLFLIRTEQADLILPYLSTWLDQAKLTTLSVDLAPPLQALTSLPFSVLQNSLIQFSSMIDEERQVCRLFRLLRVITHIVYQRNLKVAEEYEEEKASLTYSLHVRVLIID